MPNKNSIITISEIDTTPISGSSNLITSGGVFNAINSSSSGNFLPLSGGTLTGNLTISSNSNDYGYGIGVYLGSEGNSYLAELTDDNVTLSCPGDFLLKASNIYRIKSSSTSYRNGLCAVGSYSGTDGSAQTIYTGFRPYYVALYAPGAGESYSSTTNGIHEIHWWITDDSTSYDGMFMPEKPSTTGIASNRGCSPTTYGFKVNDTKGFFNSSPSLGSDYYYVAIG